MNIPERQENRDAITVHDKYPALDQLGFKVTVFDNKELGGIQSLNDIDNAKFNGCIFEFNGQKMMCYRAYSKRNGGRSNVFITLLDDDLKPVKNIEVGLPTYGGDVRQYEDARLFEHNGALHLSYVTVEYTQTYWAAVHVVRLNEAFIMEEHFKTNYDGNGVDTAQKNWIYFSDNGTLRCIHDTKSHNVLELNETFQMVSNTISKNTIWDKGLMRGGTTPLQLEENKWLAFFHSSVEHGQRRRRYSMTPYIFDRDNIISIGKTIYASTENPIVDIRTHTVWWNPIVVFPMGIIKDGSDYLVSVGVNDLYNAVMHLPEEWVMDQLPVEEYQKFETRYFYWNKSSQFSRFSTYKVLKVGSMGTQVVGYIQDPAQYAYIKENFKGIQWISKKDYDDLMS